MTDWNGIDHWARAVAAASPDLDEEQRRIALTTYRLLAQGQPVSTVDIAETGDSTPDRVEGALRSWPLVYRDEEDRVIGFWGLSIYPLEPLHTIAFDDASVFAWCGWDTLFITELLGKETRVSTVDPNNGTPIELTVTRDGVNRVEPSGAVLSILLPDGDFGPETISRFCHRIHFFSSADSAREWIGAHPDLYTVTIDDAFEMGRRVNRLRLGEAYLAQDTASS